MSATAQRPVPVGNLAIRLLGWLVVVLAAAGVYLTVRGWDISRSIASVPPREQGWVAYTPLNPEPAEALTYNGFDLMMPDIGVALLVAAVVTLIALLTIRAWQREPR